MNERNDASWKESSITTYPSHTHPHHILKPLLNGCLTSSLHVLFLRSGGALFSAHLAHLVATKTTHPHHIKILNHLKMQRKQGMRQVLLGGAIYGTVNLGVFEILTKKLAATTNNGRQLSLYQEACCGLITGFTGACLLHPWSLACIRAAAAKQDLSYGNLFGNLRCIVKNEGVSRLWKGSGFYMAMHMTASMGMLASYNRSLNYLMDREGTPKWHARMSASIISGFFAAACSHPCIYVKLAMDVLQKQYHAGDKLAYNRIPLFISQILKPYSGCRFYLEFYYRFPMWAAHCLVQWWIYERVTAVNP